MFTRPRIIPVLLIDDRDMVKTEEFRSPRYLGDAINAVKIFNRKGVDELSILDISVTKKGKEPDFELLQDIASEAFMPLSYGGGIRTIEQVRKLLLIGYEKVTLNTALIENSGVIKDAVELAGGQSIVASIDAKKVKQGYRCVIRDGEKEVDINPVDLAKKAEQLGVGEIFLNSVDKDGKMTGYDLELVRSVVDAVKIPVTACGGAGRISDLKAVLHEAGAHAAAGGSMFVYYGKLRAVLITAPSEQELINAGIYKGI